MEHKLTKSAEMKDRTGYFSTHLYRERIYQQKTMAAATHIEFTATQYEIADLYVSAATYYRIPAAGTAATVDGDVCGYVPAGGTRRLVVNVGDVISVISTPGGQANLTELG